eukprot:gene4761-biopygen168
MGRRLCQELGCRSGGPRVECNRYDARKVWHGRNRGNWPAATARYRRPAGAGDRPDAWAAPEKAGDTLGKQPGTLPGWGLVPASSPGYAAVPARPRRRRARAGEARPAPVHLIRGEDPRDAVVDEPRAPRLVQHDVRARDVAVEDVHPVEVGQPARDLRRHARPAAWAKNFLGSPLE